MNKSYLAEKTRNLDSARNRILCLLMNRDSLSKKLGEMEYRFKQLACSPSLVRKAMAERIVKKNLQIVENDNQIDKFLTELVKE